MNVVPGKHITFIGLTADTEGLLDMACLQQDAFDEVDSCMPRERHPESSRLVTSLIDREYHFNNRDEVREFFTKLIGMYKNWNYSPLGSADFGKFKQDIESTADQQVVGVH